MEKINSINEVIAHLKDRELLTGNGKDIFVYRKIRYTATLTVLPLP